MVDLECGGANESDDTSHDVFRDTEFNPSSIETKLVDQHVLGGFIETYIYPKLRLLQ